MAVGSNPTPDSLLPCGVYDFHYCDPLEKKFWIANALCKSYDALKVEVDKCDIRIRGAKMLLGLTDGLHFLDRCQSKPLTVRDLKTGDKFVYFPYDGDDSGHGGFRGGSRVFIKVAPRHPGHGYHLDCMIIAKEFDRPDVEVTGNLDSKVLKIVGV